MSHQASWSSWKANTAVSAAVGSVLEVLRSKSFDVFVHLLRWWFRQALQHMSAIQSIQVARGSWCSLPFHTPPDPNGRIGVECGVRSGRSSCGYKKVIKAVPYENNLTAAHDIWRGYDDFCHRTSFVFAEQVLKKHLLHWLCFLGFSGFEHLFLFWEKLQDAAFLRRRC